MKTKLTTEDFVRAAKTLGCEPAAIAAVARVEAGPYGAFYDDGFPAILFERHKFYKNLPRLIREQVRGDHPDLCQPTPYPRGGYGGRQDQRVKFSRAFAIDNDAAMMACSWGLFQELGENYDDYGFSSVGEFVDMMKSGVNGQLEIFIRSIRRRGLADELRRHDWKGFARNYNGPAFWKFEYDKKMASAYLQASREFARLDLSSVSDKEIDAALSPVRPQTEPSAAPSSDSVSISSGTATEAPTAPATETLPAAVVTVDAPPKEGSTATATKLLIGGFAVPACLQGAVTAFQSAMANGFISPAEVGGAVLGFVRENSRFVFYGVLLIIAGLMLKKLYRQVTLWLQMKFAASPGHNTVEVRKT